MYFQQILESLPRKNGSLRWLEKGERTGRSYATLYQDIKETRQILARWGVTAGTRVGLYAPNSWRWLVYDLALIDIGAVSVAFTDDFRNEISEDLLERYDIELLITVKANAKYFPSKPPHIAYMDGENGAVRVLRRSNLPPGSDDQD